MSAMNTDEAGALRWKGVSKKARSEATRAAVTARWEKWRAENPEKAKASEERRRKRAAKKKSTGQSAKPKR